MNPFAGSVKVHFRNHLGILVAVYLNLELPLTKFQWPESLKKSKQSFLQNMTSTRLIFTRDASSPVINIPIHWNPSFLKPSVENSPNLDMIFVN